MAPKKLKGTQLSVFSGKEARLNRVIFVILDSKKVLTSYDMYLEIRRVKGFRHTRSQVVFRRMKALCEQRWIVEDGVRPAKAHFLSPLYTLSIRAKAALILNKIDLKILMQMAPENDLQIFMAVLAVHI